MDARLNIENIMGISCPFLHLTNRVDTMTDFSKIWRDRLANMMFWRVIA